MSNRSDISAGPAQTTPFATWFRNSTPYISAHRGKTFVVLLPAALFESKAMFNVVHDLALLHVFGVRLVLVFAVDNAAGPVGDAEAGARSEAIGRRRQHLEAAFAAGLPSSPMRNNRIDVVSGNLVTARPLGVIGGVDQLQAGTVRKIHADAIAGLLDRNAIVMLPPVGVSSSGEAFYLDPAELAADCAIAVVADKLLAFDRLPRVRQASEMAPAELDTVLDQSDFEPVTEASLRALLKACRSGVPRGHLISYELDGALLGELFTAEGVGTQIAEQDYREVRRASVDDVAGIVELIRPLEEQGLLVRRPRDRLEAEVEQFLVAELDGILIGCCALQPHDQGWMELACLATHPSYRGGAVADTPGALLLKRAEAEAKRAGARWLFALTTQAQDWFRERGFSETDVAQLPASKQSLYNGQRNSKVMKKPLGS